MEHYNPALDRAFHALADPTRRAVVARLARCQTATVRELANPFPMGLPAFLKHLRVLEDSGLISSVKSGRVRTCSIRPQQLADAEQWFSDRRKHLASQLDRLANYVESLERNKEK
ncbi:helix-turn-helix transcriptional regulator [Rhizobium leguminosarum bv. viciae 248]|uniref:ArsR/SmtB family transcription factor n=1 Tax=Rhizobium leguminosarum TaxID=384 RepID=UPI00035EB84B|nr:metalloregulator ArsR/SmtB family transcription factor [Rhizobium leguminosarum]MBY5867472.1 helix-turn-helix transcriptional regulator [Rhizobium leguminosarum]MCA2411503.1 metalloregulator ArsR/SmtB family transcription factor [Rhizobium leguminosarum]NKM05295.1 metalloregulator ArsR/SmtB family transcription factor [Rhizobium leguminosarum bv. viciae]NKM64697.1 metalloregulator ArsR/SmtB family transcription factor [Rhizobium leguminosarum bv. viciae]QHW24424.1 helix-turn-helix transcrip